MKDNIQLAREKTRNSVADTARRELAAGVKIENIGRRLPYDFC